MSVVTPLFNHRRQPPRITYTVTITQGYDGYLSVSISGVEDSPKDRDAIAQALRAAADLVEDMNAKSEPPDAS